ncbi:phosphopantetheine-binding protein [Anaerosporobacter sp.]
MELISEIREVVLEVLKKDYPEQTPELEDDVDLSEYGISSVTYINVTVLLEDKYDIVFDDEKLDFTNNNTIRQLTEYVRDCISNK